jgi:hypothetical protein
MPTVIMIIEGFGYVPFFPDFSKERGHIEYMDVHVSPGILSSVS